MDVALRFVCPILILVLGVFAITEHHHLAYIGFWGAYLH